MVSNQLQAGFFVEKEKYMYMLKFSKMSNTILMMAVTFFANLYFYNHIGTLYLQSRGLTLGQIGSLGSILVISSFLAEVPTGILADKIGRKWSVVMALFIQTAGEYLYLFTNNYLGFVLISILAGMGFAFASGAGEALLYDSLPKDNRDSQMKNATRMNAGVYLICSLIAPLVGGMVVSTLTTSKFKLAILFTAISVTLAFLLSLMLKEPNKEFDSTAIFPKNLFVNGKLYWIVAVSILTNSFTGILLSLYQPYFVQFVVNPMWIGWSLSLACLFAFLFLHILPWLESWFGEGKIFYLTCILPAIGYLILALLNNRIGIIITFILTYAMTFTRGSFISAFLNKHLEENSRATALSVIAMFDKLYIGTMSLVFGVLAQYSIKITFLIIGLIIIIFSIILRTDKYAHSNI